MTRRSAVLVAIAALALGACNSKPAEAPAETAAAPAAAPAPEAVYTPVVSLNEIMVYIVDPHSNELWDATMVAPKNDAQWAELQRAAVSLAAAGNLTKLSGNGARDQQWTQQADWVKYSQAVSDAGAAALSAVRAKDVKALSAAGDQLVVSCINCHREYKLEVPTIWTERQLPPEEAKK